MTTQDIQSHADEFFTIPITSKEWDERYSKEPNDWYFGRDPSDLARWTWKYWNLFQPDLPLNLLDLGCGEGRDSVFFTQKGFDVTAVDGSDMHL